MNTKKLVLALAMASCAAFGTANAKDEGHGTVTFTGSIIDAPCSITPDSSNIERDLGQVSNMALANSGKSIPQVFTIKLEQCDLSGTADSVTTTFAGTASAANPKMLGIEGTAKGASIGISTTTGTLIELGKPSPAQTLLSGPNELRFAAYLQGDGASATIVPGSFRAIATFALTYQ
ncbi:MAG: fimbrial protein [Enterobacterales bacterium]